MLTQNADNFLGWSVGDVYCNINTLIIIIFITYNTVMPESCFIFRRKLEQFRLVKTWTNYVNIISNKDGVYVSLNHLPPANPHLQPLPVTSGFSLDEICYFIEDVNNDLKWQGASSNIE